MSFYDDHYTARQKENGTVEYWLHGDKKDVENSDEFDVRALEKMYITVTPLQCDATAHDHLAALADIEKLL
jgi:broad specificity polyphosphatase/5'/3'-nucleotidase SurE